MKSTLRIEYDFDTKQPVLRIVQDKNSDDLRDSMLKAFIEEASFENSRLYVTYPEYHGRIDNHVVEIRCERNPEEVRKGYMIPDNSTAFREFLNDRSVEFVKQDSFTEIIGDHEMFKLGMAWQQYRDERMPQK